MFEFRCLICKAKTGELKSINDDKYVKHQCEGGFISKWNGSGGSDREEVLIKAYDILKNRPENAHDTTDKNDFVRIFAAYSPGIKKADVNRAKQLVWCFMEQIDVKKPERTILNVNTFNKVIIEPNLLTDFPVEEKELITYGNTPCPRCNSQGGHPIQESSITRNAALELYHYMKDDRGFKDSLKGFMLESTSVGSLRVRASSGFPGGD